MKICNEKNRTPADPKVVDAIVDEIYEEYSEALDKLGAGENPEEKQNE